MTCPTRPRVILFGETNSPFAREKMIADPFKVFELGIYRFGKLSGDYNNGCEVRIENSFTRVTVRHHETCRVMPNSYPSTCDEQPFLAYYSFDGCYLRLKMRYLIKFAVK